MKLEEKGHFEPRPALPLYAEGLADELAGWSDVHARTHWLLGDEEVVDGADFYVGDAELGHLHLDGTAHIPQAGLVAEALVSAKLARPFRWASGWVVTKVTSAEAARHASWLYRLNYDHVRGASVDTLLHRVREKAANRTTSRP